MERLTLEETSRATFRFPVLDFYFWATEPTPPERRAEIDCGLQPAGVSHRTSVTVR